MTRWQDISPRDAASIDLSVRTDITAPLNEAGERCGSRAVSVGADVGPVRRPGFNAWPYGTPPYGWNEKRGYMMTDKSASSTAPEAERKRSPFSGDMEQRMQDLAREAALQMAAPYDVEQQEILNVNADGTLREGGLTGRGQRVADRFLDVIADDIGVKRSRSGNRHCATAMPRGFEFIDDAHHEHVGSRCVRAVRLGRKPFLLLQVEEGGALALAAGGGLRYAADTEGDDPTIESVLRAALSRAIERVVSAVERPGDEDSGGVPPHVLEALRSTFGADGVSVVKPADEPTVADPADEPTVADPAGVFPTAAEYAEADAAQARLADALLSGDEGFPFSAPQASGAGPSTEAPSMPSMPSPSEPPPAPAPSPSGPASSNDSASSSSSSSGGDSGC